MRGPASNSSAWSTLLVALAAFLPIAAKSADPVEVQNIVSRTFANLYSFNSVQRVEIRARFADGRDFLRKARVTRRGVLNGLNRMLIRFSSPADLRGTSLLLLEKENHVYDSFLYQPIYDRIRRVSIAQRHDKVFGTELAFEDLEAKRAEQWQPRLLSEETLNGRKTWVIELTPTSIPSGYERLVVWFDQALPVFLRMEFYRNGKRFKDLDVDVSRIKRLGDHYIPMQLRLTGGDGSVTTVEIVGIEFINAIPDEFFALSSLEHGDSRSDLNQWLRRNRP